MKALLSIALLTLGTAFCFSQGQSRNNLGFEWSDRSNFPQGWIKWGMPDFSVTLDSTDAHSGKLAARINPRPDASSGSFGSVAYMLDGQLEGKQVTLTGYMKVADVKDGFAGLLLRIDGGGRSLAFDNMHDRNIRGTHDWMEYTIHLPLPENAEKIFVAGLLTGSGQAWFDDFEVLIDGKPLDEAKRRTRILAKADLDSAFNSGSTIAIDRFTPLQQENLYRLAKVWGFVKYYHPTVGKGEVNWDNALFRVLPSVLQSRSKEEANKTMSKWVSALGTLATPRASAKKSKKRTVIHPAPLEWTHDEKAFGKDLSALMNRIERQERDSTHYYFDFTPNVGNPQFRNERTYPKMSYADDGMKLLSLFRYWNMIQYFFPYKHLMDENWDNVLNEFIPKMLASNDELSYRLTLLELIGRVQDTHANIWDRSLNRYWGEKMVPVSLQYVDDQVVITRFMNKDFEMDSGLEVGAVITHVNGVPVQELIRQKVRYCPASNTPTQYRDVMAKLLRTNDDSVTLTLQTANGAKTADFKAYQMQHLEYRNLIPSSKLLDGNIGYVYPGTLQRGEIKDIMEKFADTKGLIVDFRCYPSDFIVFSMNEFLMPGPTPFAKFTFTTRERPGEFFFTEPLTAGKAKSDFYKGRVVIIINETTQSSAEYHTMAFRAAPNAVVLGSTTAGADGNVSEIMLPGHIRTMISGIGVYYPDGTETQRIGIVPDITMRPTAEGIRAGRDELLERAVALITNP